MCVNTHLPHLLRKLAHWHLLPFPPPVLFTSSEIHISSLAHAKEGIFVASVYALPWLPSSSAAKGVGPWPDTTAPGKHSSLVGHYRSVGFFFHKNLNASNSGTCNSTSHKVFNIFLCWYNLSLSVVLVSPWFQDIFPESHHQNKTYRFYPPNFIWGEYYTWKLSFRSKLTTTSWVCHWKIKVWCIRMMSILNQSLIRVRGINSFLPSNQRSSLGFFSVKNLVYFTCTVNLLRYCQARH